MKAYKILLLVSLLVLAFACTKAPESVKENVLTVTFNIGGEINTSETPLTKANDSDLLLGIVIFKDGSLYGGGLFDRTNNISANFLSGHSYTIKSTLITNGKQVLYFNNYGGGDYYCQCTPFISALLTNRIGYVGIDNNNCNGADMANPYHGIDSHSYGFYSNRYYGEISEYSPTKNGSVELNLKHTVVGVKYIVSGLTDGTLSLSIKCRDKTIFSEGSISNDMVSDGVIFECDDVRSAWLNPDTYKETATVSLIWTRGTGITQDLGSINVDLLRNRMNTIQINLSDTGIATSFGLTIDNSNMGEESINVPLQ